MRVCRDQQHVPEGWEITQFMQLHVYARQEETCSVQLYDRDTKKSTRAVSAARLEEIVTMVISLSCLKNLAPVPHSSWLLPSSNPPEAFSTPKCTMCEEDTRIKSVLVCVRERQERRQPVQFSG